MAFIGLHWPSSPSLAFIAFVLPSWLGGLNLSLFEPAWICLSEKEKNTCLINMQLRRCHVLRKKHETHKCVNQRHAKCTWPPQTTHVHASTPTNHTCKCIDTYKPIRSFHLCHDTPPVFHFWTNPTRHPAANRYFFHLSLKERETLARASAPAKIQPSLRNPEYRHIHTLRLEASPPKTQSSPRSHCDIRTAVQHFRVLTQRLNHRANEAGVIEYVFMKRWVREVLLRQGEDDPMLLILFSHRIKDQAAFVPGPC